ncbi:MAG: hypothetical protein JW819_10140 [Candidatus Krumholzibacteriota bacterium]|nr:hypothetical protein [Candidatus Krumholzibacteriota bacterium]
MPDDAPRAGALLRFWAPLQTTWLLMAAEGPFLAAVIARLAAPKPNLAAYGIAFAFAIIVEAPVIMMMSAATALVGSPAAYRRLRNFAFTLNGLVTVAMLALLLPPVFRLVMVDLVGLTEEVAGLTHVALVILIPWPAAIGFRRFYQGLLIRAGLTRRVAAGTGVRLVSMAAAALAAAALTDWPGAWVGAAGLSAGVCAEAVASRFMVRRPLCRLARGLAPDGCAAEPAAEAPGYGGILRFYAPLALTSTVSLAVHPIVTFFMVQARASLESLAVLPVVNGLVFIFRTPGLSYHEVAIARLGSRQEHFAPVARFAVLLAAVATACLALIAATPLAGLWFEKVSGLTPDLAAFALPPTRVLILMPALAVMLTLQWAVLVSGRRTQAIGRATLMDVGAIVLTLLVTVRGLDLVGVTAAALAFMAGRVAGNLTLLAPALGVLRRRAPAPPDEPAPDERCRGARSEGIC